MQVAEAPIVELLAEVLHANLKNEPEMSTCPSISFIILMNYSYSM